MRPALYIIAALVLIIALICACSLQKIMASYAIWRLDRLAMTMEAVARDPEIPTVGINRSAFPFSARTEELVRKGYLKQIILRRHTDTAPSAHEEFDLLHQLLDHIPGAKQHAYIQYELAVWFDRKQQCLVYTMLLDDADAAAARNYLGR